MKTKSFPLLRLICVLALFVGAATPARAQADLWMRDDINDVGNEPNNQSTDFYLSDDIWVRRLADPNYDPTPFPCGTPSWVPLPHEGPCYRDPKTGSPNYLYVRIRNRGGSPSSGNETLHVYWAKASTGLNWPGDWNDHLANPCGGALRLYGYEVTKPRSNAATASVSVRNDYVTAVQTIDTAAYQFPDLLTYFDKQNSVHSALFFAGIHTSLRFLPWHREFINRYEALLREVKPSLTLLYWDWTTDPSPTIVNCPSPPGVCTVGYMGNASGMVGAPFASFGISRAKPAGAPGAFGLQPVYQSGTLLPSANYSTFWNNLESPSHNAAHNYIGGTMSSQNAAKDPIFFMLHANCDRVWALWQRRNSANVNPWKPAQAYDASQADPAITSDLRPWDGIDGFSPWQNQIPGDPNGYVIHKTPTHHSIVYPPIYDDALLKIPVLGANQCCIIEIPFYPPPATECGGFTDPQHLCLLARIEPVGAPAEGAALWQNVKDHNNIAWRNVSVSDCNVGPFFIIVPGRIGAAGELIRNPHAVATHIALRFKEAQTGFRSLFEYGHVRLRLEDNLYRAWVDGGRQGTGIEESPVAGELLVYSPDAVLAGLKLDPQEMGHMDVALELNRGYPEPFGDIYHLDVLQYDDESGQDPLGGQRYDLDFNLLKIVPKGSNWKYLDGGQIPDASWTAFNYDDSKWKTGSAPFGYGRTDVATDLVGTKNGPPTAYFRQYFYVADPSFYKTLALNLLQDDGLVIYLNGQEIARLNMPNGSISSNTPALTPITDAQARACRTIYIDAATGGFLQAGQNLLAAELHPASPTSTSNKVDLTFDTELAGNIPSTPYQSPAVVIVTPNNGALYRVGSDVPILADVFDPDNDLEEVRIFADGNLVLRSPQPPFAATFPSPQLGGHRVSVEAQDLFGHLTRMESVFTVLSNLPPIVEITTPLGQVFPAGMRVMIQADARDQDNSGIKQVTFYVRQHARFDAVTQLVGTDQTTPYSAIASNLPTGHYMALAVATDNEGAFGYSLYGHFTISPPPGTPDITIRLERPPGSQVVNLEWDKPGAVLLRAPKVTGPWQALPDALSPYPVEGVLPAEFYQLKLQ